MSQINLQFCHFSTVFLQETVRKNVAMFGLAPSFLF